MVFVAIGVVGPITLYLCRGGQREVIRDGVILGTTKGSYFDLFGLLLELFTLLYRMLFLVFFGHESTS